MKKLLEQARELGVEIIGVQESWGGFEGPFISYVIQKGDAPAKGMSKPNSFAKLLERLTLERELNRLKTARWKLPTEEKAAYDAMTAEIKAVQKQLNKMGFAAAKEGA